MIYKGLTSVLRVTRVLQGDYIVEDNFLEGCYRVLQKWYRNVLGVFKGCYKDGTVLLRLYYKGFTWVSPDMEKDKKKYMSKVCAKIILPKQVRKW